MSVQEVSAKVTSGPRADTVFTVRKDLPDSIEEAIELEADGKWPSGVVYSRFMASLIIDLQAFMRVHIQKEGATLDSIQAAVDDWKPGVKSRGKSPVEKLQELLAKLSPEERAAILSEFAE